MITRVILIGGALAAGTALAHHSTAVDFDKDGHVAVEGVVTRVNFVNPHVRLYVDVPGDDGAVENRQIETRPPSNLAPSGFVRTGIVTRH